MSLQDRTASAAPVSGASQGLMAPIIVIPVLALILNVAILALAAAGYNFTIPIDILGGFSFRVAPLYPAATALIMGWGLWHYTGIGAGRAWIVIICLFLAPLIMSQIMNYLTGVLLASLSNEAVTNSQNFYYILFLKSAMSAVSVLLVLAIADRRFRPWLLWVALIVVWAGGDALLFGLFRNSIITRTTYQWLYPIVRMIGFIVLAYPLQRSALPAAPAYMGEESR